ncbi:DUF4124 domain-containing protein [Massilia sp. S19_KUP03_FR1]|uniref:DUF4124 domain-containing protein n=1 Tax=Massilia sp. S19_KUP03_FR1 TaxID=3025503 RepID=UPI002FCDB831
MKSSPARYVIAISLCTLALQANGQISKCIDPKSGATTYSNTGCATHEQITTIRTAPAPTQAAPAAAPVAAPVAASVAASPANLPPVLPDKAATDRLVQAELARLSREADAARNKASSFECEQAKRALAVRRSRVTRFQSDAREPAIDVDGACGYERAPNARPEPVAGADAARSGDQAQLVNCDPAGCWDTRGRRYPRAGNVLQRPFGGVCNLEGKKWNCR